MKIYDLLRMSLNNLRRRKGRTALTVIGVVVGAVRYKRSKRVCAMLGIIFSIGGAVLYYMLRYQWGFTLFGMLV